MCAVVHRPLRNSSNSSVVEKPLVSVDEQAAISALLSLFLSCFSRFPEITVQPSIHKKICATQHIRCTSKSRSISKCWSSWRYCRDIATSHMKCYTDRHSFGAVVWQVANIAKFPKSEGCKKVPKKLFWLEFSRNVPSYGEQRNFLKLVVLFYFPDFVLRNSGAPFPSESIFFQRLVFMKFVWKF